MVASRSPTIALPCVYLRRRCDNDFRLPVIQSNLPGNGNDSSIVLLCLGKLRGAGRWNESGEGLIWVLPAHVQKNVAFTDESRPLCLLPLLFRQHALPLPRPYKSALPGQWIKRSRHLSDAEYD
jgi:hypothetical protein